MVSKKDRIEQKVREGVSRSEAEMVVEREIHKEKMARLNKKVEREKEREWAEIRKRLERDHADVIEQVRQQIKAERVEDKQRFSEEPQQVSPGIERSAW